jgi:DNA polymerase I
MVRSRDIFKAFSIPITDKEGFEADDMLGTIVEMLKNRKDIDVVIASGDMDTLQLVHGKKVQVYTLKKGIKDTVLYDEKAVIGRYGFGPELLPDYKGLRGDPSDNIVGVKGIGDKTASLLIQKFGSIENIYKILKKDPARLENEGFTPRIIKLLEEGEEEALFSKMLALIRRDAPIDFKLPEKEWCDTCSLDAVDDLFKELEFRTLGARVKEILGGESEGGVHEEPSHTQEDVDPLVLKKAKIALWLIDSNNTTPDIDEVVKFAKTNSLPTALKMLEQELEKRNLKKVYENIELPLIPIVERMEKRGIKVDKEYLQKLSVEYHKELALLEQAIWKHAGEEFNINSPRQLGEVLFEKMGLKAKNQKKTSTGAKSTRESELEKLKGDHPIIDAILDYRELQKLLSTYIDNLPHLIGPDGRLHTTLLQTGTTTGRMSSQNPNLQNIPNKSQLGLNIRKAFIAEKGHKLVSFDYSQIELRIAAFLSKDEKLIDIFKSGRDVHTEVAARVFKVSPEAVDKEMRRKAKIINFGILYGMGVNALRQNLGTDRAEAQAFYNEYFNTFTGLARYLEQIKADVERKGYTETFFGRRRYFSGFRSSLPYIRAMAERMAINAPIQGTEADVLKLAMINIDEHLSHKNLKDRVYLLLQVHDELIYEVEEGVLDGLLKEIIAIMENIISPSESEGVVLVANCAVGDAWGDMVEQ